MGYLTNLEYLTSPTGTGISNLNLVVGTQQAQDAELARRINQVSAQIDNHVSRTLGASSRTVTKAIRVNRQGEIRLHPTDRDLISLTSLQYGPAADQLITVSNLAGVWIDNDDFVVPVAGWSGSTSPYQFGFGQPGRRMMARYTYIAGFPNTTLAASCIQGATSLTLNNTVGMLAGTVLSIVDGASSEQVTVTAVTSSTAVAVTATASAHTFIAGPGGAIAVHAFPEDLKLAMILLVGAGLKGRGNESIVMNSLNGPGSFQDVDGSIAADITLARRLLHNFKVIK